MVGSVDMWVDGKRSSTGNYFAQIISAVSLNDLFVEPKQFFCEKENSSNNKQGHFRMEFIIKCIIL